MAFLLHRGHVPREGWRTINELLLLALESATPAVSPPPSNEQKRQVGWWKNIWLRFIPGTPWQKGIWMQRIHLLDLQKGIVFGDGMAGDPDLQAEAPKKRWTT